MPLFSAFRKNADDESSGDEVEDESAGDLSHVGKAAYEVLRKRHNRYHHELWNVTKGKFLRLDATPQDAFTREGSTDPVDGHDDWFPDKIEELIAKTEEWCDILSLTPPDGLFMDAFKNGIQKICEKGADDLGRKKIIRIMVGNIIGQPVDCDEVLEEMTKDLPENAGECVNIWLGCWRKGVSWNHAKIVAVDGKHLWTGGHNFWDGHYLKSNPVNDLSILMDGNVARDGHRFANAQWGYIARKQSTAWGKFVDKHIDDGAVVLKRSRVTISAFPEESAAEFPPFYTGKKLRSTRLEIDNSYVPVVTMGRYGTILKKARPSDDAFVAMFNSAEKIIRCALQDIGPVCIPTTKMTIPGMTWPEPYMKALANVMYTKGVDVELVLCHPASIPNNLPLTEACYGNGWECVDVAAEIIKYIQDQFPDATDERLREIVQDNLRVCFLRSPEGGFNYADGGTLALHSKHFIIDDVCTYIGSQNLYTCDLAEWGVLIDSEEAVQDIKTQYWDPMWKTSFTGEDCDVDQVMDGLGIDRTAVSKADMTEHELEEAKNAVKLNSELRWDDDSDDSELSDAEDENDDDGVAEC